MSDKTTINSAITGNTVYNVSTVGTKTYITDAVTGRVVFWFTGGGGGGGGDSDSAVAVSMTTAERTATTPDAGVLIWDTDLEKLFIGDGSTAGGVAVAAGGSGDVTEAAFNDLADGTQSISKNLKEARFVEANPWSTTTTQNALTLLHFSDIHADGNVLNRVLERAQALAPNINATICTGDIVQSYAGDGYRNNFYNAQYAGVTSITDWWNSGVMIAIGNHDCANSSLNYTAMSMEDRDANYIAPFESSWGITHTSGTSYYYKDFTTQNVRLIVLDCVLYNSNPVGTTAAEAAAQTAWLSDLLDSAITNNLHVVIAAHSAYINAKPVQCSFSKYKLTNYSLIAGTQIPQSIVQLVGEKIEAGLHFACYLVGHYHQDSVWDALGDKKQYMFTITCAAVTQANQWRNYSDQYRAPDLDAFNLVTVDTKNSRVKIIRGGGANIDCRMRKREQISLDYATGEIIDYGTNNTDDEPIDVPEYYAGYRLEKDGTTFNAARYVATEQVDGELLVLQAGHAYKCTATSVVNVTAESADDSYGLDGMLDISLAGGTVSPSSSVKFTGTLTANRRNICSVRFIDGIAIVDVLLVIDNPVIPEGSYIVVSASGTADGSLYYGLATSDKSNIYVSSTLNGQAVDMGGAVTNGAKTIHGMGYGQTIISGGVSCTSATTFTDLTMNGASVLGGIMTLNGVELAGSGVVVSSGHIEPLEITGGLIDETGIADGATYIWPDAPVSASGTSVVLTNTTITGTTGCRALYLAGCNTYMANCVIQDAYLTGSTNYHDAGYAQSAGSAYITGCTFANNYAGDSLNGVDGAGAHIYAQGAATFVSCAFVNNTAGGNRGVGGGAFTINNAGTTEPTTLSACIFSGNTGITSGGAATVYGSGATVSFVDCTFTQNKATYGAHIAIRVGCSSVLLSRCLLTSATSGSYCIYNPGGILYITDTQVIGNKQDSAVYPVLATGVGTTYITGCTFSDNTCSNSAFIGITKSATCYVEDITTTSDNANIDIASSSTLYLAGVCTIGRISQGQGATNTLAHVIISSGASIALAQSITLHGENGITVLDGGCVVNGANIPAGTYTQIVSSGGSAIAS